MEKKFRVGVIGVGSIAQISHLPILSAREDVELVGCMAKHIESAEKAKARYGIQHAVSSVKELLNLDLDCAFVLSPKQNHPEQVKELLEGGVDVFCEKPMGMTLRESHDMAEQAEKSRKMLMIGFNRRYAPVYQKAKSVYEGIAPDVIIAQKNRPASEYRATLENAIHMVDLMRYLSGECVSVEARSIFIDPNYETLCTAQLEFENGTIGMLVADRASGQWVETMEIHGNNKSVYVNSPDSVKIVDDKEAHVTTLTPLAMGWARVEDKLGFTAQDNHFFECLKNRTVPLTSAADAYKTHELMNRILTKAGLPNLEQ